MYINLAALPRYFLLHQHHVVFYHGRSFLVSNVENTLSPPFFPSPSPFGFSYAGSVPVKHVKSVAPRHKQQGLATRASKLISVKIRKVEIVLPKSTIFAFHPRNSSSFPALCGGRECDKIFKLLNKGFFGVYVAYVK